MQSPIVGIALFRPLLPLMLCGLLTLFCACTATRVELIRFDFFTAAVPGDAIDIRSISPVK